MALFIGLVGLDHRFRQLAVGLLVLVWGGILHAQTALTDTIIALPLVELTEPRPSNLALGQSVWSLDSMAVMALPTASVSEVLLHTGGAYLKHYGPGRLATAGLRGSSAQQTAILWQDIPIADPMLGQLDLSLLPTFLFDKVNLYFGGSSVHAGSGAVGGTLQIDSRLPLQRGWQLGLFSEIGAFGHALGGIKAGYRKNRFSTQTKFFYETADNDYTFQTSLGQDKSLPNAGVQQYGLLQQLRYHWRGQALEAHLWYQYADRELPPTRVQSDSEATQEDASLRTLLKYEKRSSYHNLWIQGAYLQGQLNFTDSLASIFSESTTHTYLIDARSQWLLGTQHQADIRLQSQWASINTTAYNNPSTQQRHAIIGTYRFVPVRSPWQVQAAFRQEWQDGSPSPFLPELKLTYTTNRYKLFAHASRTYRWPTLNDLYWEPGGNLSLVPEQGWSQELGGEWKMKKGRLALTTNISGFAQQLQDRIVWLPESGVFSPVNVRSVEIWGFAPRINGAIKRRQWAITTQWGYDWTRATTAESRILNDRSVGKQMIYVPRHQGFGRVQLSWAGWRVQYQHQWIGKVYTLADHSQSISGFQLAFATISKAWQFGPHQINTYLQVRNLWDANYEFVIQRPMPGRHFRIGINYQIQTKKK